MSKKCKKLVCQKGFTLIELITVISIVGILAVVALLNFDSATIDVKLEAASKKIMSDIIYAQDLALSSGTSVQVIISVAENRYSIKWNGGSYVTNITGGGDFIVDLDHNDFSGVSISSTSLTSGTLTFNSLGVPSTGGSEMEAEKTVAVFNSQNTIKISPYTGRVFLVTS